MSGDSLLVVQFIRVAPFRGLFKRKGSTLNAKATNTVVRAKAIHNVRYAALMRELRQRRIKLGMTQRDAARMMGSTRHWLSKIERREIRLDLFHFVRLCQVYGARPERVLRHLTEEKLR